VLESRKIKDAIFFYQNLEMHFCQKWSKMAKNGVKFFGL